MRCLLQWTSFWESAQVSRMPLWVTVSCAISWSFPARLLWCTGVRESGARVCKRRVLLAACNLHTAIALVSKMRALGIRASSHQLVMQPTVALERRKQQHCRQQVALSVFSEPSHAHSQVYRVHLISCGGYAVAPRLANRSWTS